MKKYCKKEIYIALTIILFVLVSFVWHVWLLVKTGSIAMNYPTACAIAKSLPVWTRHSILISGVLAGRYVGHRRWHIVYEKKWHWKWLWKKRKKNGMFP